jgi:hypothetical protein
MRTTASFRLIGRPGLTASAVTDALAIEPSRLHEAGQARAAGAHPLDTSIWILKTNDGIEEGVELSVQLQRLLEIVEPVTARIWALVDEGYQANWFCYVGSNAAEHAVELDRSTLGRVLALPGDMWLDVGP